MIAMRIQLYCDEDHSLPIFFPEDGPLDGAMYTLGDLRIEARKKGWGRRINSCGTLMDLCPDCNAKHRAKRLEKNRCRTAKQ